jgi:hypothetical protein
MERAKINALSDGKIEEGGSFSFAFFDGFRRHKSEK